jgi:SAM-dependent methyltransferase
MMQSSHDSSRTSKLRGLWQERAASRGGQLDAVLLARLPTVANNALHDWHCRVIDREVLAYLSEGAEVLDLGCGYGRITERVLITRPDLRLTGIDFSIEFCGMYQRRTGAPVICADISRLPLSQHTFDAILAITVLMYIEPAYVAGVVRALLDQLRPGGILLMIDPASEYLSLARFFGGSKMPTGGDGFSLATYTSLAARRPHSVGGMPLLSACLPLALKLRRFPHLTRTMLAAAAGMDRLLPWGRHITLHRWLRVKGEEHR